MNFLAGCHQFLTFAVAPFGVQFFMMLCLLNEDNVILILYNLGNKIVKLLGSYLDTWKIALYKLIYTLGT